MKRIPSQYVLSGLAALTLATGPVSLSATELQFLNDEALTRTYEADALSREAQLEAAEYAREQQREFRQAEKERRRESKQGAKK